MRIPLSVMSLPSAAIFCLCLSCTPSPPRETTSATPSIFPDYTGVTLPPNIAPPNFGVEGATHIRAAFLLAGKELLTAEGREAVDIDQTRWRDALAAAKGKSLDVIVSVWSEAHPDGLTYRSFPLHIAAEPVDPYIAYRLIPPGYEAWRYMGIYQRNLSSFDETAIVVNRQNHEGCVNCHAFAGYDATHFLFHARGTNGGTVMVDNNRPQKLALAELSGGKNGTYPYWHPSGDYVVFSSNRTHQAFYEHTRDKIEVYDLESDLMIYDVKNRRVRFDPRFTTKDDWETFPAFSPDGQYLYFCTARAVEMPVRNDQLKYALCRVPFDAKTGALGQPVDTLYSPAQQGGSASFPRLSPDGRYLLFTEAACATFPIHHREADLRMLDLTTGNSVSTQAINSPDVDSYHAWSSNGRWVIFSSKRLDGRYTRLFMAHLSAGGTWGKPFLLPQRDPRHNHLRLTSYNIPEFIKAKVSVSKDELADLFKLD